MSTSSENTQTSILPVQNVRRVRLGLRAKFFIAFFLVMAGYAAVSSTYLLRYFFDDKARYVLFSLHQGAEGACARLSSKPHSSAEMGLLLRQNDSTSSFIFDATSGQVLARNLISESSERVLDPARLWSLVTERSESGRLANFTSEQTLEGNRLFLSACRVDSGATTPIWLLFVADAGEALRPAVGLLVNLGVLFAILLVVGIGIFFVLARSLTRPLQTLTAIADDLGAGNYKNRANVKGSDELGVLSDSFAILAQRLEARESELEKTTEAANQDFLTGLWNRRYLDRRLEELFSLARRHNHDLALVYMDADHFKRINDTYGHPAGDEVLQDFARIFRSQLRDTDFVARVGGEEFVAVLPETDLAGALQVATKVRTAIKAHDFLGDKRIKMTGSLGVMSFGENPALADAQALIEAADKYAYQSKTSGRDRISSPRGQIV